jgi:hypothetical protein
MILLIVHPRCNRGSDGEDRQQRGRELKSQFLKHEDDIESVSEDTAKLLFYVQFWCHRGFAWRNPKHWK